MDIFNIEDIGDILWYLVVALTTACAAHLRNGTIVKNFVNKKSKNEDIEKMLKKLDNVEKMLKKLEKGRKK